MTDDESVPRGGELRPAVPAAAGDAPSTEGQPRSLQWRVPGGLILLKAASTAAFLVAGLLLARDTAGLAVALVAAATVGLYALRDVLAPVRLAADGDGLIVLTGYASRRRIPWRNVERIRIDERSRLGLRSALLEIDAGSSLHLFSASELGTPVEQVAEALRHLRTGR